MERIKVKAKFTYSHLRNIEKENDIGFRDHQFITNNFVAVFRFLDRTILMISLNLFIAELKSS